VDAKQKHRQVEREAAAKAKAPPPVSGDPDDPLVGTRRLSELIGRFDVTIVGEEIAEGRPAYVVVFRPSGRIPAKSIGERALDALAGRVLVDAVVPDPFGRSPSHETR
jgi:hypothetical protein